MTQSIESLVAEMRAFCRRAGALTVLAEDVKPEELPELHAVAADLQAATFEMIDKLEAYQGAMN